VIPGDAPHISALGRWIIDHGQLTVMRVAIVSTPVANRALATSEDHDRVREGLEEAQHMPPPRLLARTAGLIRARSKYVEVSSGLCDGHFIFSCDIEKCIPTARVACLFIFGPKS